MGIEYWDSKVGLKKTRFLTIVFALVRSRHRKDLITRLIKAKQCNCFNWIVLVEA